MTLLTLLLLSIQIITIAHIACLAQIGGDFADLVQILIKHNLLENNLNVKLDVNVTFLADHDAIFEMKMNDHNHLFVARLKHGMLDIFVQNVDLIATLRRVPKAVRVSLQKTCKCRVT